MIHRVLSCLLHIKAAVVLASYQGLYDLTDEMQCRVRAIAEMENASMTVACFLAHFIEITSMPSYGYAQ